MPWNVNKSITKQNSFLPLAQKHHMAKVSTGSYYGCFWSQHGEGRKCVQNSWQTCWILLVGGIFWVLETKKALEEFVTDYFIQDSSNEEVFSADEGSESETEPAVHSLQQTENGNDCIGQRSWRKSLAWHHRTWILILVQTWVMTLSVKRIRCSTVAVETKLRRQWVHKSTVGASVAVSHSSWQEIFARRMDMKELTEG